MLANVSPSRQHKAAFFVAIRAASSRAGLATAIAAHVRFLAPADQVEARNALAKRASEISPNPAKEML